jgi:heat shock protein HslJ
MAAPAPLIAQGAPPASEVTYVCPGGQDFSARFSADGELVTLVVPGQPDVELSRQVSGASFVYGDSYYELRGRGREATLAARGAGSMRCHAAGRPGQPARSFADESGAYTVTLLPDGMFRSRERRLDGTASAWDHGLWSEEIDGGLRLVLRGELSGRLTFREGPGELVVVDPAGSRQGKRLAQLSRPDPIDERFPLDGMFRVTQDGGVFAECLSGRLFRLKPSAAELQLERAWTDQTPSRDAALHSRVIARFTDDGQLAVEQFLSMQPGDTCSAPPVSGATLRDTEWRAIEIDGIPLVIESGRRQPRLVLDEAGRYSGNTGCNTVSGGYTLDAEGLRFGESTVTKMHCGGDVQLIEMRFLAALAAVRLARLTGTTLDLLAPHPTTGTTRRLRLEARGR